MSKLGKNMDKVDIYLHLLCDLGLNETVLISDNHTAVTKGNGFYGWYIESADCRGNSNLTIRRFFNWESPCLRRRFGVQWDQERNCCGAFCIKPDI